MAVGCWWDLGQRNSVFGLRLWLVDALCNADDSFRLRMLHRTQLWLDPAFAIYIQLAFSLSAAASSASCISYLARSVLDTPRACLNKIKTFPQKACGG